MSNYVTLDFEWFSDEHGIVTIEAVYNIQKPDFYSKESDWDYNGFQDLEYLVVYKDGKQVLIDIPEDVLYHKLREEMRNVEISGCFSREDGEF